MNATIGSAQQLIQDSDVLIQEGIELLTKEGKTVNLSQWLTLKKYTEKYGLPNTMIVSNWIARGKVQPENIIQLEELNGLKLIKDVVPAFYEEATPNKA